MTCCTPSASRPDQAGASTVAPESHGSDRSEMAALPGGEFVMGEDSAWSYPADGEGPARTVTVAPFEIDVHAVTNERFAAFVAQTGYRTDAECYGWSFVFAGLLPDDFPETQGVAGAPWWRQVWGTDWRHPEGPDTDVSTRGDHPVVHVSARDAQAFASWADKRLPGEAEWEYAARAGTGSTFPWGEELEPNGRHMANVWQGQFPAENTCADGWYATCPVSEFPPNRFGLYNMIGNVWEWTAQIETSGDVNILKGGSYLCHASYCRRYRPAARSRAASDSSLGNTGFRCAR